MAACDRMVVLFAALFDVTVRELRAPGRCCVRVSRVRQMAMYISHVTLQLTMTEIGQGFGRNRTTVLHACYVIEDLRDDPAFDAHVTWLEQVARAVFAGSSGGANACA